MSETHQNWAGNLTYSAARIHRPTTVEQVQTLVTHSARLHAFGARHSFNQVADTTGDHISLAQMDQVVALDRERSQVTVEAGIRYGQLARYLYGEGYALHNMASLPHITVAGACSTGTHGSGDGNGSLATAVAGLEIVKANGEVVHISREQDGDPFKGAVVGLGGLGVVTKVTLDIGPTFDVCQTLYENLPWAQLEDNFEAIMARDYSVSLFTDWAEDRVNQIWLKRRVTDETMGEFEPEWLGATLATRRLHPIGRLAAENCTEQLGIRGPWHDRLTHFQIDHTPSSGEELQAEYFVPRRYAVAALRAVNSLRDLIVPLLQISEVRTIAADDLWMSPFYGQAGVAIHFTWLRDWPGVSAVLPRLEEQLAPFEARPHWGKLFTMSPAHLQSLYARLSDFQALLRAYDPQGKFRNAFLDRYIFGAA